MDWILPNVQTQMIAMAISGKLKLRWLSSVSLLSVAST